MSPVTVTGCCMTGACMLFHQALSAAATDSAVPYYKEWPNGIAPAESRHMESPQMLFPVAESGQII